MADADASRYWRIAQADLLEARRMRELRGFRSSSIGFLLQQAAEKALKAWIQAAGGAAPAAPLAIALSCEALPALYAKSVATKKAMTDAIEKAIAAMVSEMDCPKV